MTRRLLLILGVLAVVVLLADWIATRDSSPDPLQQSISACIAHGGVPMVDTYFESMRDCKFPEAK